MLQNILNSNKFIPKIMDDYRILHILIEGVHLHHSDRLFCVNYSKCFASPGQNMELKAKVKYI